MTEALQTATKASEIMKSFGCDFYGKSSQNISPPNLDKSQHLANAVQYVMASQRDMGKIRTLNNQDLRPLMSPKREHVSLKTLIWSSQYLYDIFENIRFTVVNMQIWYHISLGKLPLFVSLCFHTRFQQPEGCPTTWPDWGRPQSCTAAQHGKKDAISSFQRFHSHPSLHVFWKRLCDNSEPQVFSKTLR